MLVTIWHNLLDMEKKDLDWHRNDIADEFQELQEARGFVDTWSEISDVAYTYSRAKWTGHEVDSPIGLGLRLVGYVYMFPKYTLRYLFFRKAGKAVDAAANLREVRNPSKVHKLDHIANKYNLDVESFINQCNKQLNNWILLK